jgi:uncharacterized protein
MIRWAAARLLKLPPRLSRRVAATKGMRVAMRDGVELSADRYFAVDVAARAVVLIRTPYGRSAVFGIIAGLFAERGLQVIIQSVRGTGGSAGQFNPMRQEQADGADTLDWLKAQPWFTGKLFTFGLSYLGNVQWAMANGRADDLDGLMLMMTLSNFHDELHAFGGFTLGGMLSWAQMMVSMNAAEPGKKIARPNPEALKSVMNHLPLGTIASVAIGEKPVEFWQEWIDHGDPEDPWWRAIDHSPAVVALAAPTIMVAGWQDIFLPFQIKDFEARQAAGRDAWLTIGPWTHVAPGGMAEGLRQAITTFLNMAAGRAPYEGRERVRVFVQGANEWRDYPSWPPPNSRPLQLYFQPRGRLDTLAAAESGSTDYIFNPADPTPALHGPTIVGGAKHRDMSALEQRRDTVTFTGDALQSDCDVIGPVVVELAVLSDREHTDFYACLCDVDERGVAFQVCDGYVRLRPGRPFADMSGVRNVTISCWPTAYRFKHGRKIRVIIASGAHPRYARNLGTGEPMATATTMVSAQQQILHDARYRSSVNLLVS